MNYKPIYPSFLDNDWWYDFPSGELYHIERVTEKPTEQPSKAPEHYSKCAIEPIEYIYANKLGFFEGNIVKYITRWREKGGVEDLKKVIHYVELLAKYEGLKL